MAEWDQHASLRVIALIFFTSLLACVYVYTCDKKQALASRQPEDHFATLIYSIPYGWRLRLMFNWVCKVKLLFLTTARGEHNCKLFVTKCVQLTPFMHVCLLYRYAKRLVHLPHTSLLVTSLQPAGTNIIACLKTWRDFWTLSETQSITIGSKYLKNVQLFSSNEKNVRLFTKEITYAPWIWTFLDIIKICCNLIS